MLPGVAGARLPSRRRIRISPRGAEDAGTAGGNAAAMERPGEVRLLVRGIAKGVEVTRIAELFAPFGCDPERIALPRDRRTRRRVLEEKTITVEIASERPPKVRRAFGARPPRRF
jgi:hypothetical protein